MAGLVNKIGESTVDNLIAGIFPRAFARGVTLRKIASGNPVTLKRGTVLAHSSRDNMCVILGTEAQPAVQQSEGVQAQDAEILTPAYILCDDVILTTTEDVVAAAYRSGNFNPDAITVAEDYEITPADVDTLRKYDIVFTQMF